MSYSLPIYIFIRLHINAVNKVTGYETGKWGWFLRTNMNSIFDIASISVLEPIRSCVQSLSELFTQS
jgi:hypothetical protein